MTAAMDGQVPDSGGIGRRVRAARERLGWTREALAFHAGVSWSAISQVESGRRTNLRPRTLAALSRPLGVSIDYLIDGTLPRPAMLEHSLFRYRTDDEFRTTMGSFLSDGLARSEATLAVTSAPKIELLREQLGGDARSVEFLDAHEFYSTPIAALEAFRRLFEGALKRGAPWVRVIGEPVWATRSAADVRAWTSYESLFNLVFARAPITVICAYDETSVAAKIVSRAHLTHPSTISARGVTDSPGYTDPVRLALEPGWR